MSASPIDWSKAVEAYLPKGSRFENLLLQESMRILIAPGSRLNNGLYIAGASSQKPVIQLPETVNALSGRQIPVVFGPIEEIVIHSLLDVHLPKGTELWIGEETSSLPLILKEDRVVELYGHGAL